VFGRRAQQRVPVEPPADDGDELLSDADSPPEQRVDGPTLGAALAQADLLWDAPRPGEAQPGLTAVFGGFPPASLIGVRLWPVLVRPHGAAVLVLADVRHQVHVVVEVASAIDGQTPRPKWVSAASISHGTRLPGSVELWRHWAIELSDHAPHEWSAGCDGHNHLPRPNAQGHLVTAIPQHDAWVMSRTWLPGELVVPSVTDVRWLVLSASDRPLKEREPQVRSRWDAVSYADLAGALAARYADTALPDAVAAVLELLPPDLLRTDPGVLDRTILDQTAFD
jgi:hypothetical protein